MRFNITKKNEIKDKSFRVSQLYDQYDLNENTFEEHFEGDIDLDREWQIGVIVGKSGTGKTTIAKELFGDYFFTPTYKAQCVIDDFPKMESKTLFSILSSVGFASPPSWLKPYGVLSNGEKMRVDLARAICEKRDIIIFDEFTSVVDREVAQLGSLALQKAVRKQNKKFIAVSCHFDIIDWLEPDWVFNTDSMEYNYTRGLVRRPQIKIEVFREKGYWPLFERYHYLRHSLNNNSHQFVGFYGDKPVAFAAFLHKPSSNGLMMAGHRFVTLPDYQGIGIMGRLVDIAAQVLSREFRHVTICTSNKVFAKAEMKNKNWKLNGYGMVKSTHNINTRMKDTGSKGRVVYSFKWKGKKDAC